MFYFVIFIQTAINTGVGIGAILFAGQCLQVLLTLMLFNEVINAFLYLIYPHNCCCPFKKVMTRIN